MPEAAARLCRRHRPSGSSRPSSSRDGFRGTEFHQALKKRRIEGVPSREWFGYSLPEAVQVVGGQLYPAPDPPVLEVPDVRPHLEFVRAPRFASTAAEVEALAMEVCGGTWKTALANAGLTRPRGKIGVTHAYRYQATEGWVKTSAGSGPRDPEGIAEADEAEPEFSLAPDDQETPPEDQERPEEGSLV